MCLSPITITSRSNYFSLSSLHKIKMQVPCNQCAECLAAKQNEYYFRSYYQSIETWDKGGYCLFDTLTYDDEHVPHINDFIEDSDLKLFDWKLIGFDELWKHDEVYINLEGKWTLLDKSELSDDEDYSKAEFFVKDYDGPINFTCFNYVDVRLFLVNLRRNLGYHGFDVKNKLKYFLCSEYGVDPRYTHRPHYHVMFYVTDPSLDPITLSTYIDKCWQRGRTDGYPYKGSAYVLGKRVFYKGADDLHMQSVCHYIGKYMTKDSDFVKVVNERIALVEKWIRAKQIADVYMDENDWVPVDLFVKIFTGKEFESKIKSMKSKDLTEFNKRYLKDLRRHCSQFVRQSQGFGLYMIEKLSPEWIFEHNCVRMPDKENVWKDIPIPGYIVSKLFKEKKLDKFTGKYYYGWSDYGNKFREYHSFESLKKRKDKILETFRYENLFVRGFKENEIQSIYSAIDKYMAGRSLDDLLFYETYMKGRIYVPSENEEPDFESFYYVDQHEYCSDIMYERSLNDVLKTSESILSRDDIFTDSDDAVFLCDKYIYIDKKFDKFLMLYHKVLRRIGQAKQLAYNERKAVEGRLKASGYNVKVKY